MKVAICRPRDLLSTARIVNPVLVVSVGLVGFSKAYQSGGVETESSIEVSTADHRAKFVIAAGGVRAFVMSIEISPTAEHRMRVLYESYIQAGLCCDSVYFFDFLLEPERP